MDNIKVAIRVRPLIGREGGMVNHWTVHEDTIKPTEAVGKLGTPYTFDRIFDELMTTYDIFEEVCKPIVEGAVQGFNGTIFAYGQSSSGKTFTMSGSPMQKGIISLAVEEIFAIIEASHHREFLIRVAYMEIYNEKVTDLLSSEEKIIKIQEDQEKNIQVTGVKEELVSSSSDVLAIIQKGDNRRHMAETKQNDRSSRSHCIIRIIIESREKGDEEAVMVAHLNFVDLAGSEKAGENSGDRLREGCSINKSLLILGQVISKLSDGVSNQHISYRDSKLTRILQISLGGNSKTAIIATITPASLEESHSTLRFASQAKKIKNKAMINEVLSEAAMLKKYQKEIHHQVQLNERGKIENQDLKKSLEQKEAQINNLKKFIIQSGPTQSHAKRKRRETWCPGKNKRMSIFRPSVSFAVEEDIFLSELPVVEDLPETLPEEDAPMIPANITTRKRSFEQTKMQEKRSAISMSPDAKTKRMMDLEDKYEALLKDHARLQTEFDDMSTFHNLERKTLEENIVELHDEKDMIQHECMKLSDEVIQTEHKLGIQTRRMTDCQNELENFRKSGTLESPDTNLFKLQQECEDLKETIKQFEQEKTFSKTEPQEPTDAIQKLEQECSILKLQVEKLEAEKVELQGVDTDSTKLASLEKEYAVLQATAKDLADERLSVQETLTGFGIKIEQIPVLKEKFEELMQENESLSVELNLLKEEGKMKDEEDLQDLKETASDLQQKLQQTEEEKVMLLSKVEDLENECKEKQVESEMTEMKEECERLRETVRELEEEKGLSKSEAADSIEAMEKLKEELSVLKQQTEKLEAERVKSVEGIDTENDKVATLEEECEVLRATVKDLADERISMQDELTESSMKLEQLPILKEKCEELAQEKESLLEEISSLKKEGDTGPETMDEEMQILREKNSNLQEQLELLEEEKVQLISKMENSQGVGQEKPVDDAMAALEEECEVLRATVKDLADERLNMQDEMKNIEQLPILIERCEELVQEKEILLKEITSIKEERKTEVEIQELQSLQEKACSLEKKLEQTEAERITLISKMENLNSEGQDTTALSSLSVLQEECERLRETVRKFEEEKMSSESEAIESDAGMQKLQAEYSVLKLQLQELEEEKVKLVDSNHAESNKMLMLEEECEVLRATVKDLADERLNMQDELTEVGVKLEQLPTLKDKCEELVQKNDLLVEEIALLRDGKAGSEMQEVDMQILREKANSFQEELHLVKEERNNLISRLELLQNECEKKTMDNKMAALEEECEVLRATMKDLADERFNMQDELKDIEQLPILKERCEELVQEKESLLMEISSLRENTGSEMKDVEMKILQEKVSNLQELHELAEEEKNKLMSRVESLQSECQGEPGQECERLREIVRKLEEENQSSKILITDSGDALQKLQDECSVLKLQIEKLEGEKVNSLEGTDRNKIATLEGECEVLRATVKDLADECLGMQEKLTDVEQLPVLKEKCEELLKEKNALLCEISSLKEGKKSGIQELELQNVIEKSNSLMEPLNLEEQEKSHVVSEGANLQSESMETPADSNSALVLMEECERLREAVRELEEEKGLSKSEAADSIEAMEKLKEELSVLKQQTEKLEAERVKSVEGIDTENDKVATLEEECEVLRATVKDLADERISIQDELTESSMKLEQLPILKEKCEELAQEKESLLEEISSLKEKSTGAEMQAVEIQIIREKASNLQEQLESVEREKAQLISKLDHLQSEGQDKLTHDAIASLEEECEVLRATVKELADERLTIQDELAEAGLKIEQIPALRQKCEELEQTNNSLLAEISALKRTNMSLEMQVTETASSLKQQLEEKRQVNSKLEVLEIDCRKKQDLEEECEVLRAKVEDLNNKHANMEEKIADLGLQADQLPILKENCKELVQDKDSLLQEISSLRQGNTDMERQLVEVKDLQDKVSSLQHHLEKSEQEILLLRSELKDLEIERQTKTAAFKKFKSDYESMVLEKKDLDEKVQNLGRELTERISQQNAESGRVCGLLEEMSEMQKKVAQSNKERNEMELKLEDTISELQLKSHMNEEIIEYQNEVAQLQEERSQLSSELKSLKQTLSHYDSPEAMQSQIEDLKLQVTDLSSVEIQKQECEDELCAKNKELDQLRSEISTLKDQLEPSQHSMSNLLNSSTPWAEEKMELLKKIDVLKIERVKYSRLVSEVNKMKEDKKMLISYCNDLEKQQQKAVDESEMGKKLKAAEADADKYYDLFNKQQTRIEELESSVSKTQTDIDNMRSQVLEKEKKLTEMQQTAAKRWEEIGEKKMKIFSQNRTIEKFEAEKQKLIQQYEETIEMKDNRIKKLQVEVRRRDAETSYLEPSSKGQKGENSTSKENVPGGAVDHYNAYMLEAKNVRLEREVNKLKKKVKTLEDNPVTKPCSCPFQELKARFEQQSEEKQRIQKEYDELKKKHIVKLGSREIDMSTIKVPDVKVPTTTPDPTEFSRYDDRLLSESKRRPYTNYPKKPFSDNECKQQ
ncbi:centromere-associated protein E-like [Ylistrum balloti]|uniref:centromere-associated protein E-like n=1 Tax=Ylistrum balloti TaxID=509963 RepID=UPI002905F3ED|nr:centromere-associated protein E-like [Ylistrum balloti]